MRVLAIASSAQLGGAELALSSFLRHRPAHVRPSVLILGDGPLRGVLERQGLATWTAPAHAGRPGIAAAARFSRGLAALLGQLRPDVVWAVGQKAALLAVCACRAGGFPLVWHKVDFTRDRLLARPLAAAAHGVVAVSGAVTGPLGFLRARRLAGVVGVPIDLDERLRARPDPARPLIVTLGRLVPYKGHHHVIGAAALLSGEFPSLRVVIAGAPAAESPGYPDALRRLVEQLQLGPRVQLSGFVADVGPLLERCTVLVGATHRDRAGFGIEALGATLLEASWVGVPVVAPGQGGAPEAVIDGCTGTLTDSCEPAALAAAIAPYLRDPRLAARTGAAGRRFARANFAPETAARRLFEALESVARAPTISAPPRPRPPRPDRRPRPSARPSAAR